MERLRRDCVALDDICETDVSRKGILLRGSTGRCKTRAMWRLLRGLFEQGKKIAAMTSGDFGRDFADACGTHTRKPWFERLSSIDVLFIDDLGKSVWTPGVWGEFFELVESRVKRRLPLLLTTNEIGDTLGKKCADQVTWIPLNRRLKEHFQNITL
jgi:DNA replication protein DnaC